MASKIFYLQALIHTRNIMIIIKGGSFIDCDKDQVMNTGNLKKLPMIVLRCVVPRNHVG